MTFKNINFNIRHNKQHIIDIMISEKVSTITDTKNKMGYASGKEQGSFIILDDKGDIYNLMTCRDSFLNNTTDKTEVAGFHFPGIDIRSLNNFFEEIEEKLVLEERTVFHASTINDVVVFEIPLFWREHVCKRSLFNLFLRCGAVFYKTTVDNALESYPLANQHKAAVDYFLDGNVFPTFTTWAQYKNGFCSEFNGLTTPEQLSKKLIAFQVKSAEHFMQQVA